MSDRKLDCPAPGSTREQRIDVLERLQRIHRRMHAGKSYAFEHTLLCDTVREIERLRSPLETRAVQAHGLGRITREDATYLTGASDRKPWDAEKTNGESSSKLVSRLRLAESEHRRLNSLDSSLLGEAADEIERRQTQNANLLRALDAKQAKIDGLMHEFCPGEMSEAQLAEWARHQQPAGDVKGDANG